MADASVGTEVLNAVSPHLTIKHPVLLASSFARDMDVLPDEPDRSLFVHFYKARAAIAERSDNVVMYHCVFSGGQSYDKKEVFQVDGDYVVAFERESIQEEEISTLASSMIISTAWSKFRDLFLLHVSQAAFFIPPLPIEVDISFVSHGALLSEDEAES